MSEKFAYVRVSARTQNEARQLETLKQYALKPENIVVEKASGKNFIGRTAYNDLKKKLRKGDLLIICSIDRLGRNYSEICNEWDSLIKLGIDIEVVDMPILNTRNNENGLTGRLITDIILKLLGYVAEKERDNTRERQRQGIDKAIQEGRAYGRPQEPLPKDFVKYYKQMQEKDLKPTEIMKLCNIKKSTYYKYAKRYETECG